MPLASEEQVPKPLTYALMYHFLWCVLFMLSAAALSGVFLAAGQPLGIVFGAPLPVVFFGLVAFVGALVTYVVRVQILFGQLSKETAFRWSAISSWGVILLAPVAWLLWRAVFDPQATSVPARLTSMVVQVELIVWWLSHLLSLRGLARGRRTYLQGAGSGTTGASRGPGASAGQPAVPPVSPAPDASAVAALAGEGRK
jgi:hypothetical protein